MKRLLICLSAVAVLLIAEVNVFASGADESSDTAKPEKVELKFSHIANTDHLWHKTAETFANEVDKLSNGNMQIKIYPNNQLGNEIDTINSTLAGSVDIVMSGESLQNWVPEAALMGVPFMFNNQEHMLKVINGEIGKKVTDAVTEKMKLVPLYYHTRRPRNLTSNKPIKTPADLKGFVIRVPDVPVFVASWKALGANPTPMAFSEVFTALQQGTIDGQENPDDLIFSASFYEVQKYINETEHVYNYIYVWMNKNKLESLSAENQEVIKKAALAAQQYTDTEFATMTAEIRQKLLDKGMEIINVDKKAFQDLVTPALDSYFKGNVKTYYNEIKAMD